MHTFAVVAASGRIVVVGGGAAGLAAAALLSRRAQVVLVEARDRLGGRIDSRVDPLLGVAIEHGAEFVHGRPELTLALARRAGVRVREIPDRHARRTRSRASEASDAFGRAQQLLARGARDDEPFTTVLREARRERRSATELELASSFVRGFYLADPATASSLALAKMTAALEEVGGDAVFRVEGGYARVLDPLRRALERGRAEIRLSTCVQEIRWRPGHVEISARGPAGGWLPALRASAAIVTLPLPVLSEGHVRFRPALPDKRRAAAALGMGPVVKVVLRFRRSPWTDTGPRALSFLHVPGAPIPVFWTLAPLRAPVLVGWAGGPDSARLAGKREVEVLRAAVRSAARGLGCSAGELEDALDGATVVDWTRDPYARGGYAVFPVGSAAAPLVLARPVDETLFFAGEATAGGLAGTVEGALRSGERAAHEALAALERGAGPHRSRSSTSSA
ncbi:MAG TPA: NAD(P)/FAD-dependent oxidoreductase [Anaeromyxobacter sp.]